MNDDFAALETERLLLRPPGPPDAAALSHMIDAREPTAHRLLGLPNPCPPEAAALWIAQTKRRLLSGEQFAFAIRDRAAAELVGLVVLTLASKRPVGQLNCWLVHNHRGRGLAGEAARRMVAFGIDTLGLTAIESVAPSADAAGMRALEAAGLARSCTDVSGESDIAVYRIDQAGYRELTLVATVPVTYAAAAALVDDRRRVLLAQRPQGKAMAGVWEFPGGKVEPGERPADTIVRELSEELSIEVPRGGLSPFAIVSFRYDEFHLLMPLMLCSEWNGSPVGREGQSLVWVATGKLGTFRVPPANLPLIGELERRLHE